MRLTRCPQANWAGPLTISSITKDRDRGAAHSRRNMQRPRIDGDAGFSLGEGTRQDNQRGFATQINNGCGRKQLILATARVIKRALGCRGTTDNADAVTGCLTPVDELPPVVKRPHLGAAGGCDVYQNIRNGKIGSLTGQLQPKKVGFNIGEATKNLGNIVALNHTSVTFDKRKAIPIVIAQHLQNRVITRGKFTLKIGR